MVGGGCCRLQMPLKLAFAARETVAGHRHFQCSPGLTAHQRATYASTTILRATKRPETKFLAVG